ncbi:MAG TPA: acylglycerol kinase family protein, partial [Candidatus Sabulitectum sp.]|nr:acylglycerol kinase family protein [Candidatus Sabulitectum sp.]
MRWLVIVNPLAGGGAAGKRWIGVSSMLEDMGIRYSARFTDSPETTRALTAEAVDSGFEGIAVYGGDGTVSDAASVLSGSLGVALAILPAGSGNDWARSLGYLSPSPLSSARAMKRESFKVTDTGSAEW